MNKATFSIEFSDLNDMRRNFQTSWNSVLLIYVPYFALSVRVNVRILCVVNKPCFELGVRSLGHVNEIILGGLLFQCHFGMIRLTCVYKASSHVRCQFGILGESQQFHFTHRSTSPLELSESTAMALDSCQCIYPDSGRSQE